MTCPHLEYRADGDGRSFDTPRAYCAAAEQFVQAMRADVCNDRYNLDHATDCEIFRAHESRDDTTLDDGPEGGQS
ncbi:hypothetical protein [Halobacterium rubrum]|uniref:hypothetical protein n=1 Tax=Halobacterium TaxID=2239 RepID=UPI001F24651A|nr:MULTISPECIES: hypothetical protein [Halobacterium]MDH5019053.1 hypothetical protein [Halobacterium rubrum]